jgi:hypothetical protein
MFTAAVRRTAAPAARAIAGVGVGARQTTLRCMATGPASGGEISDELLSRLGSLSTQALVDGLWVMGWPSAQIDNARPLAPGMKCVGRAVTLNFVPARPDIAADKPPAGNSPEYEAFELCGPNEVSKMNAADLICCEAIYGYMYSSRDGICLVKALRGICGECIFCA